MGNPAATRARRSLFCLALALGLLLAIRPTARQTIAPAAEGPLAGRIIAVDAGHGGYDGGARAPNGQWEKVYNLSVALKLRDSLHALGADVVMTRDGDYALCDRNPPMRKKRQDMEHRAEKVLSHGAELLVSIHMNDYRYKNQSGPQVFNRPDCPASVLLSEVMQAQLIEDISPKRHRAANAGDFYITSLGIPSVLIECGFLSNPAEEALLRTDAYTERCLYREDGPGDRQRDCRVVCTGRAAGGGGAGG